MINIEQVRAGLDTPRIGSSITSLDQVDTTMAEAFRLADQGAAVGAVVVAEEQTAGRGRFGRTWIAPAGSSLLCSIVLRPSPSALPNLPIIAALAASDGIEETTGLTARLKWPNDLLVDGRKAGGILVESRSSGSTTVAVIGIGINVNFDPRKIAGIPDTATSLAAELGRPVEREPLLAAMLNRLAFWLEYHQANGDLIGPWEKRLETLGRLVELTAADGVVRGYAAGVDSQGRLIVQTADGRTERFAAGEVTFQQ